MMSNALALASLSVVGFYLVWAKLPRKVRRLIQKYALAADLSALIGIYLLFGGTLTALLAGAMAGIIVSALLAIANSPEDYLFIYDIRDALKNYVKMAKEALNEFGKSYAEKKHGIPTDVKEPEPEVA